MKQWERFKHIPLAVLAHSTHARGAGEYEDGVEIPRVHLRLASKISAEECTRLALEYVNPDEIDLAQWKASIEPDDLFVPKAGEMLFRVRTPG